MSYVAIWLQACLHWRCAYFQTLSWNDTIFVVDWDILYKLCGSANKWSKGFIFSAKIWWQLFSCNKASRSTTTPKYPLRQCLVRYKFTNVGLSTTIGTIGLPRLARSLLTLIRSCRFCYVFQIKVGSFWKHYRSYNRFAEKQFLWARLFGKILVTFWYHGFYYRCQWVASSFGCLFFDLWLGNILSVTKTRIYKQNTHTHTQSRTENSLFQFWLTITKPFPPMYLEEMKNC